MRKIFSNCCTVLLLLSIFFISCKTKDSQKSELTQKGKERSISSNTDTNRTLLVTELKTETAKPIAISAIELTKQYVANEVKADIDFKGKTLVVTGIIKDIKKGIGEDIYVVLQGIEKNRSVFCYFNNEKEASLLKKEMKFSFKGTCDGLMVSVILKDCEADN